MFTWIASAQTKGGEVSRIPKGKNIIGQSGVQEGKDQTSQESIPRNLLGVTLGKTTKKEVLAKLKKENASFEFEGNGNAIFVHKEVTYAGLTWRGYGYAFHNDILNGIGYVKWTSDSYDENSLSKEYDYLFNYLLEKYNRKIRSKKNEIQIKDRTTAIKIRKLTNSSPQLLRFILLDLLDDENYDNL